MKNSLFTIVILGGFCYNNFAQDVITTPLEQNSVRATISNSLPFFNKSSNFAPGYEVPINTKNHTVYTSNFWFAGFDQDSVLRTSFNTFYPNKDIFPGPFSSDESYLSSDYINQYANKIWQVTKDEIIYHIDNYEHPNYEMPESISSWPGNGDTTLGVAWQLAPFVDVDGDGIYSPENGDYPCVKGDEVAYVILNDDVFEHDFTDSKKIGLEAHFMFYQIKTNDFIDTTTFVNVRLFNRGEFSFKNFKTTLFMDTDIGLAFEDYVGCDTNLNLGYGYNATAFDPGGSGSPGYGYNPPAFGSVILNSSMESFVAYVNSGMSFLYMPTNALELWNYKNAKWRDGTDFVVGGYGHQYTYGATNQTTKYIYPGNPYTDEGWTEVNIDGNGTSNPIDEDKRYFMTMPGTEFNSGDEIEYDFGFVFYNKGGHLENVQGLIDLTSQVQAYYDDVLATSDCEIKVTGVTESFMSVDLTAFPNPTTQQLTVKWSGLEGNVVQLYGMDGKIVQEHNVLPDQSEVTFDVSSLSQGMYIVRVGELTKKIVVN